MPTQVDLDEQVKGLEDIIRPDDRSAWQVMWIHSGLRQQLAEGLPGTRSEEAYAIAFTCRVSWSQLDQLIS